MIRLEQKYMVFDKYNDISPSSGGVTEPEQYCPMPLTEQSTLEIRLIGP